MEGTRMMLQLARDHRLIAGHLRGLFHIAIGRKLTDAEGTVLSTGMSWRDLSQLLKTLKYDREIVRELGADPDSLSPKDRERFWYAAIALANVDSAQARREAEELTASLRGLGIRVGPAPTGMPTALPNGRNAKPAPVKAAKSVVEPELPDAITPVPKSPPKRKKK